MYRRRFTELYRIDSATDVSLAAFALSGKVTRIGVQGQHLDDFEDQVRTTTVYVQSETLTLAHYPVTDAIGGDTCLSRCRPRGWLAAAG